jgi:hypothetical protein
MRYQDLIDEEVYYGETDRENFFVIDRITDQGDTINIEMSFLKKHVSIKISHDNMYKFSVDGYVEFANSIRLVTTGEYQSRLAEYLY